MDNHQAIKEAVSSGILDEVQRLCSLGTDADIPGLDPGEWRNDLLLEAARQGNGAVVAFLVQRGASPQYAPTHSGRTALHEAALRGHVEVARVLLDCGAWIEAPLSDEMDLPENGETALHQAVRSCV